MLSATAAFDEDVCRLNVAMDQTLLVCGIECISDLKRRGAALPLAWPSLSPSLQRRSHCNEPERR